MAEAELEACPGCAAWLPACDGATHRYIGASPACWAIYAALLNGGEPRLAPGPLNGLLVDAYAAQHAGTPSPQAIQSVAVHLLTLYGVLEQGIVPGRALWVRERALREGRSSRQGRYLWLTPPVFVGSMNVASLVQGATPAARTALVNQYVQQVWAIWALRHAATVADWYVRFVVPERI